MKAVNNHRLGYGTQHRHRPNPALQAAAKMPLLSHVRHGEPFDIMRSEAVNWLLKQPAIRQELWNYLKRTGAVVYHESGQWHGAETQVPDLQW